MTGVNMRSLPLDSHLAAFLSEFAAKMGQPCPAEWNAREPVHVGDILQQWCTVSDFV